jgi:hypothetical protein
LEFTGTAVNSIIQEITRGLKNDLTFYLGSERLLRRRGGGSGDQREASVQTGRTAILVYVPDTNGLLFYSLVSVR